MSPNTLDSAEALPLKSEDKSEANSTKFDLVSENPSTAKLRDDASFEEETKIEQNRVSRFVPTGKTNAAICFVVFALSLYATVTALMDISFFDPLFNYESKVNATNSNDSQLGYEGASVTIVFILISALLCGFTMERITLPGLLGMLVAGIVLRNLPFLSALYVPKKWSMVLRKVAFCVILLRGGLSLDAKALARMKGACFRLALMPCSVEAVVVAVAAKLFLGLSIWFGLTLGFVLAAVSPAVVVPSMLEAAERGYGKNKGIPTLVIAASSLDDVYAITMFSMCITVTFSTGDSILMTIVRVPLEILAGVLLGAASGVFLRYFPSPCVENQSIIRFSLLCTLSLSMLFGCTRIGIDSSGPIGVLVGAFVAANQWQKEGEDVQSTALGHLWKFIFEPLLFALIGFELTFSMLTLKLVFCGLLVLVCGLLFRSAAAFSAVFKSGLNYKEQLFVAIAWLPKATVQAALAPVALDLAMSASTPDEERVSSSTVVFAIAVLSILTTAPVGAFLIRLLAPRLLQAEALPPVITVEESLSNIDDKGEV